MAKSREPISTQNYMKYLFQNKCTRLLLRKQVLCSLAPSITTKCTHFCRGIHFLLGHAKWPPLPDCIQYGSPLAESDLMKYAMNGG